MKAALTVDDLPHWPAYPYPPGHSARSVADALIDGFSRKGVRGVYALCNSRPIEEDPSLAGILDDWVAAGHHVGNHTHRHSILHQTSLDDYIDDIDRADKGLAEWIAKAPSRFFRYTWNIRGETEEKRAGVKAHIEALGYRPAECSSMFFEWDWDEAYINCLRANDEDGVAFLKKSFIEFVPEQFAHDDAGMRRVFGREVPHILLLHNLSFIELVLDDFLDAMAAAGVEYVSLEEADADGAYDQAGDFPCGEFLIYWRKLLWRDGIESDEVPPSQREVYDEVLRMAEG